MRTATHLCMSPVSGPICIRTLHSARCLSSRSMPPSLSHSQAKAARRAGRALRAQGAPARDVARVEPAARRDGELRQRPAHRRGAPQRCRYAYVVSVSGAKLAPVYRYSYEYRSVRILVRGRSHSEAARAQASANKHETINLVIRAYEERIQALMTAADELAHENYHDIGRIFSRCVCVCGPRPLLRSQSPSSFFYS